MDGSRDPPGILHFRQVFVMTIEILSMQGMRNDLLPRRQSVKMRRAFRSQNHKYPSVVPFGLVRHRRCLKHLLRYLDLGL